MGVHYLIRNLEHINGRLPFKLTFNIEDKFSMESDAYIESYKEIARGRLQYIGIDGSVIIHSKVVVDKNTHEVNIEQNANEIVKTILVYVQTILIFFNIFNNDDENKKDQNENKKEEKEKRPKQNLILHFVVDGEAPCQKNRIKILDDEGNETFVKDAYSLMSLNDKRKLHEMIIKILNEKIQDFNEIGDNKNYSNLYKINLLTNCDVSEKNRGEGELELYKVCQMLNKKQLQNNYKTSLPHRNVIISSDSDLISLMLMHQDENLVVISPLVKNIFITNFKVLTKALNLTTRTEIIKYLLLHFIFFGSDYNLGLMSNPNDNKKRAIYDGIKNNINDDINQIAQRCNRKRKKQHNDSNVEENNNSRFFLQNLKESLIYEAICAFMYYFDLNDGKKYLLEYSPLLYKYSEAKKYIPLLIFNENNNNNNDDDDIDNKKKKTDGNTM